MRRSGFLVLLGLAALLDIGAAHAVTPPTLSDGLFGYWDMENGFSDASGNARDGAAMGNATTTSTSAKHGRSASFDGAGDFVELGNIWPGGNTDVTLAAWVRTDEVGSGSIGAGAHIGLGTVAVGNTNQKGHLYIRSVGPSDDRFDGYDGDVHINVGADDGATDQWWATRLVVEPLVWYYVVVAYNSATREVSIYVDGVLDRSVVLSEPLDLGTGVRIGVDHYQDNWMKGLIDDAAIWTRVLGADEVAALFALDGVIRPDAPPCTSPPPDLLAWWPGDSNALDIAGGRDGTLVNGAAFGAGKVDQAFSFNGGSWVDVPDDSVWSFGSGPFTIDLWVKFNSLSGRDPFIAHDEGGGGNDKWIFWYDASGHRSPGGPALRFHVYDTGPGGMGAVDPVVFPWNPSPGRWYHVAVTREGDAYTLYLDGAPVIIETHAGFVPDPAALLTIGRAENYWLNGQVDEVEILKRALSGAEIQAIYAAGSAGKCKTPPNQPPVADAGDDQRPAAGPGCMADVILDGTRSHDADPGDTLGYEWTGPFGTVSGATPTVSLPLGRHTITLTVDDGHGGSDTDTVDVTVIDTTAPAVSSSVAGGSLWPPNHKLVNVGFAVSAQDACDATLTTQVMVFGDEDDETPTGDGNHSPDASAIGPGSLRLRAERRGDADGRVYLLVSKATDDAPNVGFACSTLVVPKSQSAASVASVNAQAAAALALCRAHDGAAPPGFFVVGDGPVIGPKQ